MDDCLDAIKDNRGVDLVLEDLPLDDKATYELLARGDTLGVFQLDGGPMRSLLRSMVPDNFEDISAVLRALPARPDGRQRAQRLRRPQEQAASRSCRSTPSWPSRSPRSWATPTA